MAKLSGLDAELLAKASAYQCIDGGPFNYTEAAVLGMLREVADTMPQPATIEAKIHGMRDELRELCDQLMKCARFEDAYKVLGVVIQLDTLAETDDFGLQAWPPRVEIMSPDGERDLAPVVGHG